MSSTASTHGAIEDHSSGNKLFGFWIYLMSDLIIFAILFATFAVIRENVAGGPGAKQLFDLPYVFLETMFLLVSSVTYGLAIVAMNAGKRNLVFAALTFVVLLGTVYPLATEALFHKKITVGEPYFNQMALPLSLAMLFLMGVGPMLPWGAPDQKVLRNQAMIPGAVGLAVAGFSYLMGFRGLMPLVAFGLGGFVTATTLRELFLPAQQRMSEQKEDAMTAIVRSASRAQRRFGGYVVHLGIVAIVMAVAASSAGKVHSTGQLKKGQTLDVGAYKVRFDGLTTGKEPHREWVAANVSIIAPDGTIVEHHSAEAPRMNYYERSNDPIGSPMVQGSAVRDVYVSLLAFDMKGETASFNAWVFPLVGWIWYSIPILVLGTLIALWPQRKQKAVESRPAPAGLPQGSPP